MRTAQSASRAGVAIMFLVAGGWNIAYAESTLSISSSSGIVGGTVSLGISLNTDSPSKITGLQWTLDYSTTDFSDVSVSVGSAASGAGKSVQCNGGNCMIIGFNANTVPSGTVATAVFTISSATPNTSSTITISAPSAVAADGGGIPISGGSGSVVIQRPTSLNSLGCSPGTVAASGTVVCTVSLTAAAPTGGVSVALSSSDGALSVPASVTVTAGSSAAAFSATAGTVVANTTATVTASLNGTQKSFPVTVTAPVGLSSLSCSPATIDSGSNASCTVSLTTAAPTGGVSVALSSSKGALSTPASVTVVGGSRTTTFGVSAGTIDSDATATVTASLNGTVKSFPVTVTAPVALSSLSCARATISSGSNASCTVSLSKPALAGDFLVFVSSSSSALIVPPSVTVLVGAEVASFVASARTVSNATNAVVTVTAANRHEVTQLTVEPSDSGAAPKPLLALPGPQVGAVGVPLHFSVSAKDQNGVRIAVSTSRLPEGARYSVETGNFDWTPGSSQVGGHAVVFTATTSANVVAEGQVLITINSGTPTLSAMVGAADYSSENTCSPGALVLLLGTSLTQDSVAADRPPLPTELDGIRVSVDGQYAPLLYVSPTQVNFQCPDVEPGTSRSIKLSSPLGESNTIRGAVQYSTPAVFSLHASGSDQGVVLIAETGKIAMVRKDGVPSEPARPGDFVTVYATGLGRVSNPGSPGTAAAAEPLSQTELPVQVRIGGVYGEVIFAGLAPGYVGLYQVSVKLLPNTPIGDEVPLSISVTEPDGKVRLSNAVTIAVREN
jgi:uncharacterized protein (TIGR03437 family)